MATRLVRLSAAIATAQEGCLAAVAPATAGTNCAIDNPTRTNIGASYDLGVAKPMFQYTVSEQDTAGQLTNTLFGVTAPFGPVLLKASCTSSPTLKTQRVPTWAMPRCLVLVQTTT